ncbi:MAG: integrase core domain-containing protein [Gammaproteobacteria bacterium]
MIGQNSWETFLKAHWEVLAATDFFTVEVWTLQGLLTHYVLFFIELATRSVDGFLLDKRYLILDRDTKYSQAFLEREDIDIIRLPPRSPNLNAYAERFVRSIKEELINRMIFFGEASLRRAIREYMVHYHTERKSPRPG